MYKLAHIFELFEPLQMRINEGMPTFGTCAGLNVEENQARRLLNDLAAFTAHYDLGGEDRILTANRWLTQVYEPIMAMVPAEARGKLERAEIFHETLVHRWYLSERAGHEIDIFDSARDYIASVLSVRPHEALTTPLE